MRIIIDLQGRQSPEHKKRGVGRYSLSISKAIVRNRKKHEIFIVLSSLFPNEVKEVQSVFRDLLPPENIYIWQGLSESSYSASSPESRKKAELSRELFLKDLNPDVIYITSLFEGLNDDVITSVGMILSDVPTVVTLYDLIPLINEKMYLGNPTIKQWYLEKIDHLKQADLLLAISESSRQEALTHLNVEPKNVVNISTASDLQFKKLVINNIKKSDVLNRYHIKNSFLMYTGGIDPRKNIKGLIRAYGLLPLSLRKQHQLAIVCSIQEQERTDLASFIKKVGLSENEVLFTGFVTEEDLVYLYNLCRAFIFPSWHEGFGLPVLEAMQCGAPVIVANVSSLPEVVGLDAAMFDPYDDQSMADKIELVVTDDSFRQKLIDHASKQVLNFSWDISGKKAIKAFEAIGKKNKLNIVPVKRLKLAYVSPLPPVRSGISDYSAELLVELYDYYDIDVVVEQNIVSDKWVNKHCNIVSVKSFKENSGYYDRVIYHLGNSEFHQHMFNLLIEIPGTVVLHDFYLSGAINFMSGKQYEGILFEDELFYAHGNAPFNHNDSDLVMEFPCNKKILDYAKGIIVHSANSIQLAKEWYGKTYAKDWSLIPLLKTLPAINNRVESRLKLNIPKNAVVIATFGGIANTKCNVKLFDAWLSSSISNNKDSYLIFVGENDPGAYGKEIKELIDSSKYKSQVFITGWVDHETYSDYLSASDIGVQLRTLSRGETSAAVLDCMNYGLATIVNANGAMADLSQEGVLMLSDEFKQVELKNALESLYFDINKRDQLGKNALNIINEKHIPARCANQYVKAIEDNYARRSIRKEGLHELKIKLNIEEKKVIELENKMNNLLNSSSWKVTSFFRFMGRFIKMILSKLAMRDKLFIILRSVIVRIKKNNFLLINIKKIVYKYPKLHDFYLKGKNASNSNNGGFKEVVGDLNRTEQQVYIDIQQSIVKQGGESADYN